MPGPSPERVQQAQALLDEVTFGGYSHDGAYNAVAVALDLAAAEARKEMMDELMAATRRNVRMRKLIARLVRAVDTLPDGAFYRGKAGERHTDLPAALGMARRVANGEPITDSGNPDDLLTVEVPD